MSEHDPEVTPEQEARLRRLLAQARHGEPVPDDVAERLDRVLAQLAVEEVDPDATRSVVDLAARRRRRVSGLLAAAAAVVVVGVGVNQLVGQDQGDDMPSADSGADNSAASADEDFAAGERKGLPDDSSGQSFQSPPDTSAKPPSAQQVDPDARGSRPDPVRLSADGFAKQVVRYSTRRGTFSTGGSVIAGEQLSRSETFVCDGADWGAGLLLPALYDGVPAVLAYREVEGETQTVDLLRCGTGDVLRSTVLPVEG